MVKSVRKYIFTGVAMITFGVCAESEMVDDVQWSYTVSIYGEAMVGGSSYSSAIPQTTSGRLTIPSMLGGYPVTRIRSLAFRGCSKLTSITIPNSVTSIEPQAFEDCDISVYDTTTISGVGLIDGWVIGRYGDSISGDLDLTGIRGIAGSAFSGCSGLTSVIIPDGIKSIGCLQTYEQQHLQ